MRVDKVCRANKGMRQLKMSKAQASGSSFGALKEEFLLNRYIAALHAENIKNRGLQILFNRMERERVSLDRSTRFDNVSDDLTIGQKKNERPTFGKTNPFPASPPPLFARTEPSGKYLG